MGNFTNKMVNGAKDFYAKAKHSINWVYDGTKYVFDGINSGMDRFENWIDSRLSGIPILGGLGELLVNNPIYGTVKDVIQESSELLDEAGSVGRGLAEVLDPVLGGGGGQSRGPVMPSPISGGVAAPVFKGPIMAGRSPVGGGVVGGGGAGILPGARIDVAGNSTVERSSRQNLALRGQNISSALR